MGIDIYLRWDKQTEAEKQAQYTGYSTEAGNVGYLREAYHGAPYVTKYFLQEAFDAEGGEAPIPAAVLKSRLPVAVMMAMFREAKLYGKGEPGVLSTETDEQFAELITPKLKNIFENEMHDNSHKEIAAEMDAATLETAKNLIETGALPGYAKAFVDFAQLAEEKEKLLGQPCVIVASY